MSKKIEKRKCFICHEMINLEKDDFVPEKMKSGKRFSHKDCFIQKKTTTTKNRLTKEECLEYINECVAEYDEEQKKKQGDWYDANVRTALTDYILARYNITYLPKKFYVDLDAILSGKSHKVSKPIPPEDLFDMWKLKASYLDKVAEENRRRGKDITGEHLVRYDLAILLSKYDSYLKWKTKKQMEMAEQEQRKIRDIDSVDYNIISNNSHKKKDDEVDIMSMLDEI